MKKTVLLIVPWLQLGGQERICAKTAELLREDFDVSVIVFDKTDMVFNPYCPIIDLNIHATNRKLKKIINVLKRACAVKKIRKLKSVNFVYSFGATANLVNILSAGYGKTIIGYRGFKTAAAKNFINRIVLNRSDLIIGCSEEICKLIRLKNKNYEKKTVCLYNPLDMDNIKKNGCIEINDYSFSQHTIISHGRLDNVKDWPRLIKAFSLVKKQLDDAQLLIIGEGPQRNQLEQLICDYGLLDCVKLIGFRSNPFAYLSKASLYVLSSFSEGFPNSLLEGMVFLPSISVDCKSGPREILSRRVSNSVAVCYERVEYGVLVQPSENCLFHEEITNDDAILAEAILFVLKNKELMQIMKKEAFQRVTEFSCDRYKKNLVGILESNCLAPNI